MNPVRRTMTMRATVERDTKTDTDAYGGRAAPTWTTLHASLPCRVWAVSEREVQDGDRQMVVASQKMAVPKGTDITERDRIASIKDRRGNTIIGNAMLIRSVAYRGTHLELDIEEVSGG